MSITVTDLFAGAGGRRPRIGSLFSGYGGLEMGVQAVIGGSTAWHVEFDAAPSKVLAHHWPDVPNYGDITKVDWSQVEPVDVLTGGFPCQDVSLAGLRRGLKAGTRSGLWSEFAKAIDALRPRLVVIENVRGLLSAEASGVMESDPWAVGDGSSRPTLRALGAVLGDLSDLGYDAEWCGVRAADAGAPHGRFRVFIVAYPQGVPWRIGNGTDLRVGRGSGRLGEDTGGSGVVADSGHRARYGERSREKSGSGGATVADSEYVVGYGTGRAWDRRTEPANSPVTDPVSDEPERWGGSGVLGSATGAGEVDGEEWERVRDTVSDSGPTVADADGVRWGEGWPEPTGRGGGPSPVLGGASSAWGVYAPAIARWEAVTGRVAPAPTLPDGKGGNHRLSALLVEWMMGLPLGHVTDPAIGLTRNEQLKALGNGVVPQQAELALRMLLSREQAAA